MTRKRSLIVGGLSVGFLILAFFIIMEANKAGQRNREVLQTNSPNSNRSKKVIISESEQKPKGESAPKTSGSGLKKPVDKSTLSSKTDDSKGASSKNKADTSNSFLDNVVVESNIEEVVEESWKEFEKLTKDTASQMTYRLIYFFDLTSKKWRYYWKPDAYVPASEAKHMDPSKNCHNCNVKKWNAKTLKNNESLNSELKENGVQIAISSPHGRIFVAPVKCIQHWYDYDSKNLQSIGGKSPKESLKTIQKTILKAVLEVYQKIQSKFGDIDEFKGWKVLTCTIGNNDLSSHTHLKLEGFFLTEDQVDSLFEPLERK